MEKIESFEWASHPAIDRKWLAMQLYGETNSTIRSKLSKKLRNVEGKGWLPEEKTKLEQIRLSLLDAFRKY